MEGLYLIICEGESECNYLSHLTRFLSTLPPPKAGSPVPLRFIPKPSREDPEKGKSIGCGGGDYTRVAKAYKAEWKSNRQVNFGIWVDADLYVRDDKGNQAKYANRPEGVPAFNFSVLNFEDFLALHAEDEQYNQWAEEFTKAGHFKKPLVWSDYESRYRKIFPDYQKNALPIGFLTKKRLQNLFRHLDVMPQVDAHGLRIEKTFAGLLRDVMTKNYPEEFGA